MATSIWQTVDTIKTFVANIITKPWICRTLFVDKRFLNCSFVRPKWHRQKFDKKGTFLHTTIINFFHYNGGQKKIQLLLWFCQSKCKVAKCKLCDKVLKTSNATSGVKYHNGSFHQNILIYFVRCSFVVRRQKTSDLSFFDKNKFPRNLKALVTDHHGLK